MLPRQRSTVIAAALAALVLFSLDVGYLVAARPRAADPAEARGLDLIEDAFKRIIQSSSQAPNEEALARGAIRGMIDVLSRSDEHATFYSPQEALELQEQFTGQTISGIGVFLKPAEGALRVESVIPNSPAGREGLRRGDLIRSIDGTAVAKMTTDEAVSRIKGPTGTLVDLIVDRSGEQLTFTITRRVIRVPNLQSRLEGNVGIVELLGFTNGAGEELEAAVDDLLGQGAEGIVLDLRDNGGGLFTEGVNVASVFIEDGTVVIYKGRTGDARNYEAKGDAFEDVPLVVLINGGSASASEIVAGALKDSGRAVLVGSTTYGKGSVQEVIYLEDGSTFKVTVARYLTPAGLDIEGRGIDPDVVAGAPRVQLRKALDILRGLVAQAATGG